MVRPYTAFVGTYNAALPIGQSANVTFSFCVTGFEANVQLAVLNPATNNISSGAEIYVYTSSDGGTTWNTVASIGSVFPRGTNAENQRRDLRLQTGYYLIRVLSPYGSATTWSIAVNTAQVITAYDA